MDVKHLATLINLNHPQQYFHWSIFTISIANLIIIAVMIFIFGLAVILPFPKSRDNENDKDSEKNNLAARPDPYTSKPNGMWTNKVRNYFLRILPPGKLLPDRQPAYVSSWIYVFGVATLAALGLVVASGLILAIGGVNWWHESSLGHFINSIHLWSVELFMAFMVIH